MNTIKIDPRDFINPPYWKCPKCNTPESFGVLMICDRHYVRRCKKCWYTSNYDLPELNKKVIYLDQFAISNMMKALNPKTKAYQKRTLDEFWVKLFERLDTLCKSQLIICPYSGLHTRESSLSTFYSPLKRMYEHLSYGICFYNHDDIKRFQVTRHAGNWIYQESIQKIDLNVQSVVHGNINGWQDRLIFSFNWHYSSDWIDELWDSRKKVHQGLTKVFKRWELEQNRSFDDWFEEESKGFGRTMLRIYTEHLTKFAAACSGFVELTINELLPPSPVILIHSVQDVFRKAGIPDSELRAKTAEYFLSSSLKKVPFIKIASMMWAALARKVAKGGRKRPPDQGIASDIETISVVLPYCDAIFIDKECHSYLKEVPLRDAIDYGTKVFSLSNKEEFFNYLDLIEENTLKEHLEKVDEVYGKSWREPYTTIYNEKK